MFYTILAVWMITGIISALLAEFGPANDGYRLKNKERIVAYGLILFAAPVMLIIIALPNINDWMEN